MLKRVLVWSVVLCVVSLGQASLAYEEEEVDTKGTISLSEIFISLRRPFTGSYYSEFELEIEAQKDLEAFRSLKGLLYKNSKFAESIRSERQVPSFPIPAAFIRYGEVMDQIFGPSTNKWEAKFRRIVFWLSAFSERHQQSPEELQDLLFSIRMGAFRDLDS